MNIQKNIYLSVVIPTCDRGPLLNRALDCVFKQTHQPDEIVVIDNGIKKADIDRKFLNKIQYFKTTPRIGASRARNYGVEVTKGQYISFLDDDDIWDKNYLKIIFETILNNKPDAILAQIKILPQNKTTHDNLESKVFPHDPLNQRKVFYSNPGITGQNLSVKKEAFLKLGGFDPLLPSSEDRDFAVKLISNNCKIIIAEKAIAYLCEHGDARASHKIVSGNFAFYKKNKLLMTQSEKKKFFMTLTKRFIKLIMQPLFSVGKKISEYFSRLIKQH